MIESSLRMIDCRFEDGGHAKLRHVVVDAIVLDRTQVLLVKRAAGLLEAGRWGLVGGFMERDETVREAVAREVMEETGYVAGEVRLLRIKDDPRRPGEDRQNVAFVCVCSVSERRRQADSDEVADARWWPLDALPVGTDMAFDHAEDLRLFREGCATLLPAIARHP